MVVHSLLYNCYLKRLVRILVQQDSKEALTDAIQIAHTYSDVPEETVYLKRIHFLINKERVILLRLANWQVHHVFIHTELQTS